ncbi:KH domain-containing protein [Coprinopsis cinerea AmutBmut pab1-1]|nr:KH domain-containing protein [Coprinopsis cinerea AmutBmut pab1-1]
MSTDSKSKWDQAAPEKPAEKSPPPPEGTAKKLDPAEAAAQAAAIAAKIAAQFAAGGMDGGNAEHPFVKDIDINDVRNRYMLTKGTTQQQIKEESGGAVVSTKGVWYPDRSKATEKDPPLYLHVTAPTAEVLQKAIDKINELMTVDLGSLVEDKRREKRKWPEEKLPVGLESIRNFNVRAKVVGPSGSFVKYIQQETGARVQIKGAGSGFIDQETGREGEEPLYIHITGPDEGQVGRAKVLAEDLLLVVRSEHAKQLARIQQEQAELHAVQMQYAAYSMGYPGVAAQVPGASPGGAPPPPGDQPPPPPGGGPTQSQFDSAPAAPGAGQDPTAAYTAYWAAYGYDVNSPQFKEWMAQQYQQYYAQAGATQPTAASSAPPPPPTQAPPPPGPPPS